MSRLGPEWLLLALLSAVPTHALRAQSTTILPVPQVRQGLQRMKDSASGGPAADALNKTGWQWVTQERATAFWGTNHAGLLGGSGLSLKSKAAALYTEMGFVNSGAWRYSVGTTIAAADTAQGSARDSLSEIGFQRFLAGGGNLSVSGIRPLAMRLAPLSSHYLFIVPRAWFDIPALSDANDVTDYGGEAALEYHYDRKPTGDSATFLQLSLRSGLVVGSDDFYRTIGSREPGAFGYIAPSATFVINDALKLGLSGFFAPRRIRHQGKLQLNLAVVRKDQPPPKPGKANDAAAPNTPARKATGGGA